MMQLALPTDLSDFDEDLFDQYANTASISLGLLTVAGLAFLWFMGVARDLLGRLEDQFLSTISLGSGLLFLALLFVWAAIGGAILVSYSRDGPALAGNDVYRFGRTIMSQISGIYAIRMAGVYVFSSGTAWFRTGVASRWLVYLTWGVAIVLWLFSGFFWWIQLVFPAWVFLVSIYVILVNDRG